MINNTKDENFKNLFKVEYIKDGDNKNFPSPGERVTVHYTGQFENGKKFDSSVDRNQPFQFNVQTGEVIKCWDEVVSRMSLGEKLKVVCPSKLAYGSRGAGRTIPPNTDIGFEIELLGISRNRKL